MLGLAIFGVLVITVIAARKGHGSRGAYIALALAGVLVLAFVRSPSAAQRGTLPNGGDETPVILAGLAINLGVAVLVGGVLGAILYRRPKV